MYVFPEIHVHVFRETRTTFSKDMPDLLKGVTTDVPIP